MRVAVLGAGGTIAPAIVRDLAESQEVEELVLLDLDAERAAAVADAHGQGKAIATRVDARAVGAEPGALAGALAGCEALVNSASYRVNLDAMRACLEAQCHYLDLGGLYWLTKKQLELDGEFERAGLVAILGIGSAPGKTNLMARVAADRLGGSLDEAHVAAAGRDLSPPPGFSVPYALQTLVDEVTMAPVALRDAEPVELEPMTDGGTVEFGEPVGPRPTIHTLHSELLTFGSSFGCREASFRLALAPPLYERLRELVGASEDEVARAALEASAPSADTVAVHLVDASSGPDAIRVRAVTRPHGEWGIGGGVASTATPAAAAVRLLARGSVTSRGVLPPERCLDPEAVFAELEARGTTFDVELKEGARA